MALVVWGRRVLTSAALTLVACGGNAKSNDPGAPAAEGGAGAGPDGAAGEPPAGMSSGGGTTSGGGTASSEAGAAGRGEESPPDDGSGQSLCVGDWECPTDVPCTAASISTKRACLTACSTDEACFETQRCVSSDDVPASCFPLCEWPWDCAYEFDCVLPKDRTDYVCVPAQWATSITGPKAP